MAMHDPLTRKVIGCAMEVHNVLGNGFQEVVYQRALAVEMAAQGIGFERELEIDLLYKGHGVGTRRVDFLIEHRVLVEIKAVARLEDIHLAQGLNYLTAYELDIGLLLNFGGAKLEFKRLFRKPAS
jgi:GxxExxY protein